MLELNSKIQGRTLLEIDRLLHVLNITTEGSTKDIFSNTDISPNTKSYF